MPLEDFKKVYLNLWMNSYATKDVNYVTDIENKIMACTTYEALICMEFIE